MKTFDVFLNKAIKTLLVVNIIIMLIIGAFFVQPVFAVNDSLNDTIVPNVDFVYNSVNASYVVSNGQPYYDDRYYVIRASSGSDFVDSDVYVFSVNDLYLYFVAESRLGYSIAYTYSNNSSVATYSYPTQTTDFNSTYNLYCTRGTTLGTPNHIPNFSSIDEGLQAVRDYIDNSSASASLYEGFRLPPGYSARIQVSSGGHFDVSCTMGELCATSGVWVDNTQKYLFSDSAAVGSALDSGTLINWAPSGNLTAYGQTYEAFYSFSSVPSGTYMWITNPVYMNVANQYLDNPSINGTIVLSNVVNVQQIRLFPLSTDIGKSGIGSSGSDDDYYNAVESNGAIIYEGSDGSTSASLPEYGNTNVPGSSGNQGIIERFQSLLEDLVSRIESLLIAPVTYIQRIISAGSTFFTWLSGLWSWLPAPVSGIITSVLYVMAVVGALKLLWR